MVPADDKMLQDRVNSRIGTALLVCGSMMAILIFADRTDASFLPLPSIWYQTRGFHFVICLLLFGFAAILLKSPGTQQGSDSGSGPVFRSVRVFTRDECGLCDDAVDVLQQHQQWLPQVELINIDKNPSLCRQFGESVPVVEIDGRIRFRGAVHPILLQRLINGVLAQSRPANGRPGTARSVGSNDRATSETEQPG